MVWVAKYDDVLRIHEQLVTLFADENDPISPAGIKNDNMLRSACERPNTGIGSYEKYPAIRQKAAALFHSLTKNHAFHNGNKRTALVALITMLYRNDYRLRDEVSDDELYDMVLSVTTDTFPETGKVYGADQSVENISNWIANRTEKFKSRPPGMKANEFLECCRKAGASVRESKGGSWVVAAGGKSIRFSMSTSSFSGPVVRRYLRKLGLDLTGAGLDIEEFLAGASAEREQIRRYMHVLRRLAKT
jgi:death-on-curing family protein